MARRPSGERKFQFSFEGWRDGWYVLTLPTRGVPAIEVHGFRNSVFEWLIDQEITPNDLSYMANGNTGDGPVVPSLADGTMLGLLLRRAEDVLRVETAFGCRGVTSEAIHAALRAQASVHKFVMADIALIAYDAIRRFVLVFGNDFPQWIDLERDEQQFFMQLVREYLEHPDWSAERLHEAWMDRRLLEEWRYDPEPDLQNHLHPSLVPFSKLGEREQTQTRLTASVIASLASLLKRASR